MEDLEQIFLTQKEVGPFLGWSDPEPETGYIWFNAPLEIGGVTQAGLVLHGGCYADEPEQRVNFELAFLKRAGRSRVVVARLDWRSRRGHSNRRRPQSEWSGKKVSRTHYHDFYLNYDQTNPIYSARRDDVMADMA